MKKALQCTEKRMVSFFQINAKYLLGGFCIGILAYFMMMSLNLVNHFDGIWHLSNFIAGDWEISLGRGLQRYADRFRFGIVSDSFNTILTLLLAETANVMILDKFQIKKGVYPWLLLLLLTANPVICASLTYSYMSVNFGLGYLFSVMAFYFVDVRGNAKRTLLQGSVCGVILGVSMSFYQAYISVTGVLAVILAIKMLDDEKDAKAVLRYIALFAYTVIFCGCVYFIITKALLMRAGIQLASYKGAGSISLLQMIIQLPDSIKKCYVEFLSYILKARAFSDLEFIEIILTGVIVSYVLAVIMRVIKALRDHLEKAVLYAVMFLLLPVASCMVLLIAVGNSVSELMSMGFVICIALLGIVFFQNDKSRFWLKRAGLFFLAMFAWYQLSAVTNDQLALKEGKKAVITLTENMVSRLYNEGYLDEYETVAFIGRPANNDSFAQSAAYQMANEYAKFGSWSVDARNNRASWNGIISNFLGVNLDLCSDNEYESLAAMQQVADMPEFPAEGSICVIGDVIAVKVSDVY